MDKDIPDTTEAVKDIDEYIMEEKICIRHESSDPIYRQKYEDWRTGELTDYGRTYYSYDIENPILRRTIKDVTNKVELEFGTTGNWIEFEDDRPLKEIAEEINDDYDYFESISLTLENDIIIVLPSNTSEREMYQKLITETKNYKELKETLSKLSFESIEDCRNYFWLHDQDSYYQLLDLEFQYMDRMDNFNEFLDDYLSDFVGYVSRDTVYYNDEKEEMNVFHDYDSDDEAYARARYFDSSEDNDDFIVGSLITIHYEDNTPREIVINGYGLRYFRFKLSQEFFNKLSKYVDIRKIRSFTCYDMKIDEDVDRDTFQLLRNSRLKFSFIDNEIPIIPAGLFSNLWIDELIFNKNKLTTFDKLLGLENVNEITKLIVNGNNISFDPEEILNSIGHH